MRRYQIINYDVWGNSRDGYEVNEANLTKYHIELPEDYSELELKRAMYRSGYTSRGFINAKLSINHDYESCIYITLEGSRYSGKPFCELRLINNNKLFNN
jgi:hypothetical protein